VERTGLATGMAEGTGVMAAADAAAINQSEPRKTGWASDFDQKSYKQRLGETSCLPLSGTLTLVASSCRWLLRPSLGRPQRTHGHQFS
jgi:hypothetical protein